MFIQYLYHICVDVLDITYLAMHIYNAGHWSYEIFIIPRIRHYKILYNGVVNILPWNEKGIIICYTGGT